MGWGVECSGLTLLSSISPSSEAGASAPSWGLSFSYHTLSCREQGEGLELMPPSRPPMLTTGLGTNRALRKVSTYLPLACTTLAEGTRVAKVEGHPAETKPGGQSEVWGQEAWN